MNTDTVLMVRPKHFGFDPQTASDNYFQVNDQLSNSDTIKQQVIDEFDRLAERLNEANIQVIIESDSDDIVTPDSIFPNNWFSTHQNGTLVTYPLKAPNRRKERRIDIINKLKNDYLVKNHISLEHLEDENVFLEGTGSLVLDRFNKIAYACISGRTNRKAFDFFCQNLNYQGFLFSSVDKNNQVIYHTNVMMAVGQNLAIICLDSIKDTQQRNKLVNRLERTNKKIIEISLDQVHRFAGNMLELISTTGTPILTMSDQALQSLDRTQIKQISSSAEIVSSPIPTIEKLGGGSVRCMLAEIFLPAK